MHTTGVTIFPKRIHVITFLMALFVCLVAVLWMAGPYLLSLFLGGMLAILTYPVYHWFRTKKWGARLSAGVVTVLMLLLVFVPLAGFSILAVKQGVAIGQQLAGAKEFSSETLTVSISRWPLVSTLIGDPAMVNAKLKSCLETTGEFISLAILRLGRGMPELLLQLILALLSFYFFLLDGERFMNWLLGLGVLDQNMQAQLVESFRNTTISAVLSGLASAAALAALIVIGFLLLDIPNAFLAGGITFIFSWVPLVGTAPALLAGFIYLYMKGATIRMALMIPIVVAEKVLDNVVRPMVLRGRAGMHPLLGLVVTVGGLQLFGILGVFIGPILAALLLSLLGVWPSIRDRLAISKTGNR